MNWEEIAAEPDELIVVVGQTASGKTELALQLAERLGGEILSADSVQIYRYFDIGSGKPSAEQRQRVRHHLIDVMDPRNEVDAAMYASQASEIVDALRARGVVPIVCGGTYLWIRALLFGLAEAPKGDAEVRRRHRQIAEEQGCHALHAMLAHVDPALAQRLHPNDVTRVSRGLEVYEVSGVALSEWQSRHGFSQPRFRFRQIGVMRSESEMDLRISLRAEQWLQTGWIEEVSDLVSRGYGSARAMSSVGYREVFAYLRGELPQAELHKTIVRSTRIFARRQRTWLRDQPVVWCKSE